jgi:hypothetical protein
LVVALSALASGYLMIALYRSGHVSRVLQAFHRIRAVLKEELGVRVVWNSAWEWHKIPQGVA